MRICYDSTTASDIPPEAEMVAGYCDGRYRWSDANWALFPNAVQVRIAVFGATDDGVVGDVEAGCMTPGESLAWTRMRRAAGVDPTLYVNLANVGEVRALFERAGEPQPHYWLAHYDGVLTIPDGYVAKQYANSAITGGHYDASSVAAHWPGVDREEAVQHPIYLGESVAVVVINPNDPDPEKRVARMQAAWRWPDGRERSIERKAYGKATGMHPYVIYPPADPDADVTEDLDAQPGVFIVVVSPL